MREQRVSKSRLCSTISVFWIFAALVVATGCDDKIKGVATGTLDWSPEIVRFGKLAIDESADRQIELTNTGTGPLGIERILLDVNVAAEEFVLYFKTERDGQENVLIDRTGEPQIRFPLTIQPQETLFLVVNYTAKSEEAPTGAVIVRSNDSANLEVRIPITLSEGGAEINVAPNSYDFGRVPAGEMVEHEFTITNVGQLALDVNQILLNGSQDFVPLVQDGDVQKDPRRIDRDILKTLQPNESMGVFVRYEPQVEGPDQGQLSITSSDPRTPEVNVNLTANGATPCLRFSPGALEFRTSLVNRTDSRPLTMESCGGETVTIRRMYPNEGGDPAFSLVDLEAEGVSLPLALPAYSQSDQANGLPAPSQLVQVEFTPREQRIHNGSLVVESDDPTGELVTPECVNDAEIKCWYKKEVSLLGRGVLNACPQARAAQEEFYVVPLDVVALDGSPSIDQDGPNNRPVEYEWVITSRPEGSTSQPRESFFDPGQPANDGPEDDRSTPNSVFFVDLAGTYTAELRVRDNLGLDSIACENPAVVTIVARPEEAIHVQLVWRTPLDEDETDREGTDLDLHLLHPNAANWGDSEVVEPYDCYYLNPTPDWGQLENSEDDPSLDIDDINGAGPENANLNNPENTGPLGSPYLVGVQYYSSHGRQTGTDFESSCAKLRIFIRGELAWEYEPEDGPTEPCLAGEKLMEAEGHFWDVANIEWPSGDIAMRDRYTRN
jgi:hypothetical protein